jgi:hypothetical protein
LFTAVSNDIERLRDMCSMADEMVVRIENEYGVGSSRLDEWAKRTMAPAAKPVRAISSPPKLTVDIEKAKANPSGIKLAISDEPPRIPPLPFETVKLDAQSQRSAPAWTDTGEARKGPVLNKSFSAIEDQMHLRNHFRSTTQGNVGYVARAAELRTPSGRENLAMPKSASGTAPRRKDSTSDVPRVFTGSFVELEKDVHRMQLHKVTTPEAQPSSPISESPERAPKDLEAGSVSHRDIGIQGNGLSGTVEQWLAQQAETERTSPKSPDSVVKRGLLRQREHTL